MGTRDLEIAARFRKLVELKVTPRQIRIFGSRARGTAADDTDLDIFVTVDHCTREVEKYISDCAWEAGFPDDVVVVAVVVEPGKLDHGPLRESAFILNVYRDGIQI